MRGQRPTTQGVNTDTLKNSEDVDAANQNAAARGIFALSSVRQGALNDLAVTLGLAAQLGQTNRDTALSNDQTQRTTLGGEDAATQTEYWGPGGLAVTNAQSVAPRHIAVDHDDHDARYQCASIGAECARFGASHDSSAGHQSAGASTTAPHTPSLAAAGSALISHAAALRAANPCTLLRRWSRLLVITLSVNNGDSGTIWTVMGKVGAPV